MAEHGEANLERPVEGAGEHLAEADSAGGGECIGTSPSKNPGVF